MESPFSLCTQALGSLLGVWGYPPDSYYPPFSCRRKGQGDEVYNISILHIVGDIILSLCVAVKAIYVAVLGNVAEAYNVRVVKP